MYQKQITVSNIESPVGRIILHEQVPGKQYPDKYSFFQAWPDGNQTDPYTQFLELGVRTGGTYTIEVEETQSKTANKFGNFTNYKNVKRFLTGGAQPGQNLMPNQPTQPAGHTIQDRLDKMAKWAIEMTGTVKTIKDQVSELQAEVAGLKAAFGAEENPAYTVHKELDKPLRDKLPNQPVVPAIPVIQLEEVEEEIPFIEGIAIGEPQEVAIDSVPF
jgi:hypothetical protein